MKSLAIVTCTQKKLTRMAPAWLLYLPSPSFRTIAEFALSECTAYMILSAKHGLLHPSEVIAPYDQQAKKVDKVTAAAIAAQVAEATAGYSSIRYYGGADYCKFLTQIEYTRGLEGSLYTRLQGKPKASGPETGSTLPIVEVFADAYFHRGKEWSLVEKLIDERYQHPVTRQCQKQRLLFHRRWFSIVDGVIHYKPHLLDHERNHHV